MKDCNKFHETSQCFATMTIYSLWQTEFSQFRAAHTSVCFCNNLCSSWCVLLLWRHHAASLPILAEDHNTFGLNSLSFCNSQNLCNRRVGTNWCILVAFLKAYSRFIEVRNCVQRSMATIVTSGLKESSNKAWIFAGFAKISALALLNRYLSKNLIRKYCPTTCFSRYIEVRN